MVDADFKVIKKSAKRNIFPVFKIPTKIDNNIQHSFVLKVALIS